MCDWGCAGLPGGPIARTCPAHWKVSCANLDIEPVGEDDYANDDYQAQVQFRITFPAAHDPAEDWSFQGIPSAVGATR